MDQHPNMTKDEWLALHSSVRSGMAIDWGSLPEAYKAFCSKHGYDPAQPTTWIGYVDVNSLYPTAMSMNMPIGAYNEVRPEDP